MVDDKSFAIIIPVHNEESSIRMTLDKVLKHYADKAEIIVVNDGSTDNTSAIVSEYPGIKYIAHKHQYGYGAALKSGITSTDRDILCFIDADGQHNSDDIQRLVDNIGEADMVIGSRGRRAYLNLIRAPGKYVIRVISNYLVGQKIPDLNSGLRAIKRNVILRYIHLLPDGFSASSTMTMILLIKGYEVNFIPIKTQRRIGKSEVKQLQDGLGTIVLLLRIIMLFNPLKIFLPFSIFSFSFGVVYGIYKLVTMYGHGLSVGSLLIMLLGLLSFIIGLLADQISTLRQDYHEGVDAIKRFRK